MPKTIIPNEDVQKYGETVSEIQRLASNLLSVSHIFLFDGTLTDSTATHAVRSVTKRLSEHVVILNSLLTEKEGK